MSYKNNSGWLCCQKFYDEGEKVQEESTNIYERYTTRLSLSSPPHRDTNIRPITFRPVYSFKDGQVRIRSNEKITPTQTTTLRAAKSNQKMLTCSSFRKQNHCSSPVYFSKSLPKHNEQLFLPRTHKIQEKTSPCLKIKPSILANRQSPQSCCKKITYKSPTSTTLRNMKSPSSKIYSNMYSLTIQAERPTLKFNTKLIQSKMKGKRIRTAEQQTEYSSKHSQIQFRNSYEGSESTGCYSFQKKNCAGEGNFRSSVFQDQTQKFEYDQQRDFPSCQEVSAHEQFDHSISNQFLRNARSINSIVTSTEMRSKRTSREPSNLMNFKMVQGFTPCLSPRQSQGTLECPTLRNQHSERQKQERVSTRCQTKTPRVFISQARKISLGNVEEQLQGQRINSSIFYADEPTIDKCEPKIVSYMSCLNINDEEDEDQQLQDVVDEDINISKGLSGDVSIFASARQSLKNVEDHKVQFLFNECQKVPQDQFQMLKEIRIRQKRTNTIFSMESVQSQNSCLDIKFMQKHRTRREVSKLIRQ